MGLILFLIAVSVVREEEFGAEMSLMSPTKPPYLEIASSA
jgi:hypothetical protein